MPLFRLYADRNAYYGIEQQYRERFGAHRELDRWYKNGSRPTSPLPARPWAGVRRRWADCYSGIPTIRREMKRAGLPEPVFENRRNEFVVTLFNRREEPVPKKADTPEERILAFCAQPRSRKEIAEFLGVKTVAFAVSHYVAPLLEAGKLEMTIPEKPKSRKQRFVARL